MQNSVSDVALGVKQDFTVLMSVYHKDNPDLFVKAVTSVFDNTLMPAEIILVCDGPLSYKLDSLIETFQQSFPMRCVRLKENSGLANALNYGLKFVNTAYIARADSDDFNMPNRFQQQFQKIQEGYDIVGSSIYEICAQTKQKLLKKLPTDHPDIVNFSRRRNPFNHMTVFLRTQFVRDCGGYPNIYLREDYALWAKMICMGARTANLDAPLVIASAGRSMVMRRRGLKSAISEVQLQKYLQAVGLKSVYAATTDAIIRAGLFLLPSILLRLIYKCLLRRVA